MAIRIASMHHVTITCNLHPRTMEADTIVAVIITAGMVTGASDSINNINTTAVMAVITAAAAID